ncbi:hypothetical protein N7532_007020 [Penicillium argentinense]|uniref:Uncharacterized protein n=1 Tax=Penicillium argentinense TaxID=1131581 RepID=A0A9W9KBC9_9EURO|nr:uncharacterized protein N7532_007020 [Penicillium argentinense]KAJ5100019.1 hypothetical protein N7532_007020 [Penicillium argentinense]
MSNINKYNCEYQHRLNEEQQKSIHNECRPKRNPQNVQAWLIGRDVASLAAAVHLITKAKVPAHQVHILDIHHGSTGVIKAPGAQPYFHEECVKDILNVVPSLTDPDKSCWENIKEHEWYTRPINQSHARVIRQDQGETRQRKARMDLIEFILDDEKSFGPKKIGDLFDKTLFESEFWTLWSTTFMLQKWHSASEFHRLLCKYLPEMHTRNSV